MAFWEMIKGTFVLPESDKHYPFQCIVDFNRIIVIAERLGNQHLEFSFFRPSRIMT